MVRARLAEYRHNAREQSLGAGALVHRLDREPQRINADHRGISRAQAARCDTALSGQVAFIVGGPRRRSISILSSLVDGATVTGTWK